MLQVHFARLPGEQQVLTGFYFLFSRKGDQVISKNRWTQAVLPGSRIRMSIALKTLRVCGNRCPRKGCHFRMVFQTRPGKGLQALYANNLPSTYLLRCHTKRLML